MTTSGRSVKACMYGYMRVWVCVSVRFCECLYKCAGKFIYVCKWMCTRVQVWIFVCVCVSGCVWVMSWLHIYVWVYACVIVCICVQVRVCEYIQVCACVSKCLHVSTCVRVCVCVCVYLFVCLFVCLFGWLVWFYDISTIVSYLILFTNPSARAGYDTRSIFNRSLTGLN